MVSLKRWLKAQEYERLYWAKAASRIASRASSQLGWYSWRAGEMEKRLVNYLDENRKRTAKVLEVGSGPIGIVTFLKWGECYTIDPLEEFYRSNAVLSHLRSPAVHYGQGVGEDLPFEDASFSLVILDNVLDHVSNAEAVLREIYRVLSEDGILYLAVNVHTQWGAVLHSLLSRLNIDKGHPYTFTASSIHDFLLTNNFSPLSESVSNYHQARKEDRKSRSLKGKVKGYTGLSEFIYYTVARKIKERTQDV